MNAQSKKLTQLAASILMVLAVGNVGAADNSITLEQAGAAGGNGTNNYANIAATGSNKTVSIYQVGYATSQGSGAENANQVGDKLGTPAPLTLNTAGSVKAHIGQGGYWSGTAWEKSATDGTKGNLVKGTISAGEVEVSQNSNGNTAILNVNDTGGLTAGKVTITQGFAGTDGGGGSNHTATVNQSGASTGDVTISQGNDSASTSTNYTATVTQTGSGAVTITQGVTGGASGEATVVHDGSHTVTITQTTTGALSAGVIRTKTAGDGGSLTINHSGTGNTYVNAQGQADNGTATAATITGSASLTNAGSGTLALKEALGTVVAKVNGSGTLTINNTGAVPATNTFNKVYVDSLGTGSGSAITNGGTLTLNSNGDGAIDADGNVIKVTSYTAGITTINQDSGMKGSILNLSGGSDTNATITQRGDYQNATVISANGSTGNFYLDPVGTGTGARAEVNLTY